MRLVLNLGEKGTFTFKHSFTRSRIDLLLSGRVICRHQDWQLLRFLVGFENQFCDEVRLRVNWEIIDPKKKVKIKL